MGVDGCPLFDASETPSGVGTFSGLVLGGLLGSALGGLPGALLGGLIGAAIGNTLEGVKPVKSKVEELRREGKPYVIHVDSRYLAKR